MGIKKDNMYASIEMLSTQVSTSSHNGVIGTEKQHFSEKHASKMYYLAKQDTHGETKQQAIYGIKLPM
jgi:hypothetical protein